jgi:hypothetical protein
VGAHATVLVLTLREAPGRECVVDGKPARADHMFSLCIIDRPVVPELIEVAAGRIKYDGIVEGQQRSHVAAEEVLLELAVGGGEDHDDVACVSQSRGPWKLDRGVRVPRVPLSPL